MIDNREKFKGLGVALVTPFKDDETVDFDRLSVIVDDVVRNGADYLLALGTTSEYVTLSPAEKDEVLRCISDVNAGRLPMMVGLGGPNTKSMIMKLEQLTRYQVDAILTVTPYYNKPSQAGLLAHYQAFASATDLPIFLYNVPGRTSCNLENGTTLKIIEKCENVVGIKEASGNMRQILQLLAHKPADFLVLSGDDLLAMPLIAAGASGLISVMANAFPREMSDMVHFILKDNLQDAKIIANKMSDLIIDCFKEGSPAGIKAILSIKHNANDVLRLPLVPVSDKLRADIAEIMKNFH